MKRHGWPNAGIASIVLCFILTAGGCSSDELLNASVVSWELIDDCDDGLGIQLRFFDEDSNKVWPSATTVWILADGESAIFTPDCKRDHVICYGATTDPGSATFWGVGIDSLETCNDCCVVCGNGDFPTDSLSC